MTPPKQTSGRTATGARERFFWAFFVSAVPTWLYLFLLSPSEGFVRSTVVAVVVGLLCGVLAAVFGKRVLDFLMEFPW